MSAAVVPLPSFRFQYPTRPPPELPTVSVALLLVALPTELLTITRNVEPLSAVVVRDSPKAEKTASGKVKTEEGVYLFQQQKVKFVPIQTGLSGELSIEVRNGVEAGQQIVTGPFKALRSIKDGDKVMIEKEKKGGPGQAGSNG